MILEHFSGHIVQSVNNVIELFLGNVAEICPFGEVSPKQSIGIFVGPPLPGTVRVGKIRPHNLLFGYRFLSCWDPKLNLGGIRDSPATMNVTFDVWKNAFGL